MFMYKKKNGAFPDYYDALLVQKFRWRAPDGTFRIMRNLLY